MHVIEATHTNEKKSRKIVYSFLVRNEKFEASYNYGKNKKLDFFHNGTQVKVIEKIGEKDQFTVDTEEGSIRITAWIDKGFHLSRIREIGIEVNGDPVKFTTTDPHVHIENGRQGLGLLLFVLAFRAVWKYFNDAVFLNMLPYIITTLIVLVAFLKYKKLVMFSLMIGGILSILEFVDYIAYIVAMPNTLRLAGDSLVMLIPLMLVRISAFILIYDAFKWNRKLLEDI